MVEKKQDGRSKKRPGVEEQTEIITAAAIELFIEHGTKTTSIAQICKKADVSKPTFYRCFKDKEELISYLYQHSINNHVGNLLSLATPKSIEGKNDLDTALDTLFDTIFENANSVQLLFREYGDPSSPATQIIDETFENIAKRMEKGLKASENNVPSRTFLKAMMSAFQWIIYDTIKAGLTPKKIKEAKQASHELASALFTQMR